MAALGVALLAAALQLARPLPAPPLRLATGTTPDTVTVGELTLNVRHCPGHTPGHVVFHHPESNLAIVGDVLFKGSIGRWDFPMGNHQHLIDSITQRLWPLGDDVLFNPGHGPRSTFGQERATNPWVGDAALA